MARPRNWRGVQLKLDSQRISRRPGPAANLAILPLTMLLPSCTHKVNFPRHKPGPQVLLKPPVTALY